MLECLVACDIHLREMIQVIYAEFVQSCIHLSMIFISISQMGFAGIAVGAAMVRAVGSNYLQTNQNIDLSKFNSLTHNPYFH